MYVPDASKAVGVVSRLLGEGRAEFAREVAGQYQDIRTRRDGEQRSVRRVSLAEARANRHRIDWAGYAPPRPTFTGLRSFEAYDLAELAPCIDWTPFFKSWDLAGVFPRILDDAVVGEAARALYADARAMLDRIVGEGWFTARAVVGLWPANSVEDDLVLYAGEDRDTPLATLHTLRQQLHRDRDRRNLALADFVAPRDSGVADYLGAFVVTAGHGVEDAAARFEAAHDDYGAIMVKALADRLAEAFAERMHQRVRTELWGYAPDESLDNAALIREAYRGIRPAPGYPACPDHTEKRTLFDLLEAPRRAGVSLTESCAMTPASSVSGLYLAHPDSRYFGVSRVERDQVEDYARRKAMSVAEIERWLAPVLGYDPAVGRAA